MRNNLVKIFEDTVISNYDEGNTINNLIKLNIINLNDLTKEIINTKNIEYIFKLALYIKNAPVDKLIDIICETTESGYYIFALAELKNAPIEKLANAIIRINNVEDILAFAEHIKNAPIDKLADIMIKTGNIEYIYFFARDVENAPINKLEKAIIETNDMKYIKLFFKDIKNKLIAKQSNIPEITCSDEEIELENYNTLLDYIKENNYKQIKENKKEFAILFSDNKSKKLIKRKSK